MNPAPPLLAAAPEVAWHHLQWNNFYSARYGLHYIATPKVACTTLKWWFAELEGVKTQLLSATSLETLPDLVVHDTLPLTQPQCAPRTAQAFEAAAQRSDVLRFAFVRHPVARIFSAWASKVALAEPEQAQNLPPEHTQSPLRSAQEIAAAFERFVDAVIASEAALGAWSDPHWAPQTILLQPQVLNYTGGIHPIERLPAFARRLGDWAQSRAVHIPFALGRYNESVLPYCADWVSDSARRQIAAIYADDFAAFGYDAQALPPGHAANTPQIIDRAWAQMQTVRERNQRFAALRRQLLQQALELEALRASREGEREAARALLVTAQVRLDAVGVELENIQRSRSWRWTQPMRDALRAVRRVKYEFRQSKTEKSCDPSNARLAQPDQSPPISAAASVEPTGRQSENPIRTRLIKPEMPRLLIVTPDFHGPIRNGGIGTAFAALAEAASRQGWEVTVAYALGQHSEDGPISRWVTYYAECGVTLVPLDDAAVVGMPLVDAPLYRRSAWRVHHWLRQNQNRFDVVVFPEWMGLAYYVLLAKRQGLHYGHLSLIVNTHSPEAWAMEGNRQLPEWPDDIDRDFMERESVRHADAVVSPSAYLLGWMRQHHWELPPECLVLPNLMPESLMRPLHSQGGSPTQTISRLVFFGRLEPRKGLKLFCDAIDRLPVQARQKLEGIIFLGKAIATTQGFDSRAFIAQRAVNWEVPIHVHSNRNRDEALTELAQRGTLAVIPSLTENSPYTVLECLTRGIVLLASRVGGIPEMLAQSDHATHLFDPNPRALAQALHLALEEGMHSASLAWNPAEVERRWQDFLQDKARVVKQNRIKLHSKAGSPLVSICLVHYNRPHLLAQVLDSLRAQTYRNFEVVLVDDGSPGEAAQRYLDAIQSEFHGHGWQIIRQPNSYLGTARNHAAQAARGDYLLFMDDDNVALPYMLEHFVQAAESSGADILTCVNMPFTGDRVPPLPERIWVPLGGAAGAGLYRNAFGDANALWKRSAFEHIGGYTTDYGVGHEDWELFSDAVLAGLRLEVVPEPLYWYRVNPQGMLRAGDHWADHARSVRPYLRHDPNGLGMALAYGLYLQRLREVGANGPQVHAVRWSAVVRLIRLAADPSLRAQFLGALRAQGVRAALRRALAKAGR